MPTERFINLQRDKQQILGEAIIRELHRTPYGELKLSNIASYANVSRSSLYTYFQDKEDMFLFAMEQIQEVLEDYNKKILLEAGGDFWKMMEESLKKKFQVCGLGNIHQRLYLAALNTPESYKCGVRMQRNHEIREYRHWLYRHSNKTLLNCSEDRFNQLLDTCESLKELAVRNYLLKPEDRELIEYEFQKSLNHLRTVIISNQEKQP